MVGFTLDVKMQAFTGLWVYWDMEVNILKIYKCYPFTSMIDLLLLSCFETKNSLLKKARDVDF